MYSTNTTEWYKFFNSGVMSLDFTKKYQYFMFLFKVPVKQIIQNLYTAFLMTIHKSSSILAIMTFIVTELCPSLAGNRGICILCTLL